MEILRFLKENTDSLVHLSELVDAFEKMCALPLDSEVDEDDDIVLFETGIYSFTEKPQFWFSLVRQFPNGDGEYFQLHMDVFFTPDEKNSRISSTEWSDCVEGNFFEFVRNSEAYLAVRDIKPEGMNVYLDET